MRDFLACDPIPLTLGAVVRPKPLPTKAETDSARFRDFERLSYVRHGAFDTIHPNAHGMAKLMAELAASGISSSYSNAVAGYREVTMAEVEAAVAPVREASGSWREELESWRAQSARRQQSAQLGTFMGFPVFGGKHSAAPTKADADGWIEWGGGKRPVGHRELVKVKFLDADSSMKPTPASWYRWAHVGSRGDITAYRIVS